MITAEHKTLRRGKIGGTIMSAIAGVNPYKSAADAYLELRGEIEDQAENDAMAAGSLLESAVLDWAEGELGVEFNRDIFEVDEQCPDLTASIDAMITTRNPTTIIEAKTTGITGPRNPEYGEAGTDQLPQQVLVQVQHYMGVVGCPMAYVPVLIGGEGFKMYRVERDREIITALRGLAINFMEEYVKPGIRPDNFAPSLDVVKRLRREPGKVVDVPDELVDAWIVTKAAVKQASEDAEAAQAELLLAMGDADGARFGKGTLTYLPITRKAYQVAECTYRQLRIKRNKGE